MDPGGAGCASRPTVPTGGVGAFRRGFVRSRSRAARVQRPCSPRDPRGRRGGPRRVVCRGAVAPGGSRGGRGVVAARRRDARLASGNARAPRRAAARTGRAPKPAGPRSPRDRSGRALGPAVGPRGPPARIRRNRHRRWADRTQTWRGDPARPLVGRRSGRRGAHRRSSRLDGVRRAARVGRRTGGGTPRRSVDRCDARVPRPGRASRRRRRTGQVFGRGAHRRPCGFANLRGGGDVARIDRCARRTRRRCPDRPPRDAAPATPANRQSGAGQWTSALSVGAGGSLTDRAARL